MRVCASSQLPVSALPQVDYPTIQVLTFYPGASPEVMASSVTSPLERQFGQVPGLTQMTSSSSEGCSVITLRFDLALDIDVATLAESDALTALLDGRTLMILQPAILGPSMLIQPTGWTRERTAEQIATEGRYVTVDYIQVG